MSSTADELIERNATMALNHLDKEDREFVNAFIGQETARARKRGQKDNMVINIFQLILMGAVVIVCGLSGDWIVRQGVNNREAIRIQARYNVLESKCIDRVICECIDDVFVLPPPEEFPPASQ